MRHVSPAMLAARARHELWMCTLRRASPLQRRWYAPDPSAQAAQVTLAAPAGELFERARAVAERHRGGRVLVLGAEVDRADWGLSGRSRLWTYERHYQTELTALAALAAREPGGPWLAEARGSVEAWAAAAPPGTLAAWEPYPAARRVLAWAEALALCPALGPALAPQLLAHLRFLRRHVEWHLLGNHLLCDASALVAGACVLSGPEAARLGEWGARLLRAELRRQVLPDGGYAERAPLYHALVARDAALALTLSRQRGLPLAIESPLSGLLRWLSSVRRPGGGYPCLNDSTVEAGLLAREAMARGLEAEVLDPGDDGSDDGYLPDTGWTQVREGRHELLFEHGPLGPDEQPGHGHSDALSFELVWDGAQVIQDSGTSEYQGGVRAYERSARAHATATVDGEGPDELWKDFRAGGRAQVTGSAPRGADKIRLLRASLRAWQGWTHERRIAFRPGRALVVQDEVRARKGALVESRLTLAPGFSFAGGRLLGPRPLELRVLRGEVSAVEEGSCASGFGQRVPRQVLVLRADAGRVAYALCAPGVEAALLPGGVLLDGAEVAP